SLVERRTRRGYGVGTMRAELRSRGVGDLRIDDALSGLEPGAEAASAAALARRLVDRERGRRDADARGAERVAGALARRGFDVETVRAAVRAAWKEPLPDE
ncbi:MAG TPA: RecX family transcriptional regulator, partial [Candidatus Dormibacteraeota bacterium]|nr:RecX family transcriptional regulator [Candidatus Dormibacteraeota bacterium]